MSTMSEPKKDVQMQKAQAKPGPRRLSTFDVAQQEDRFSTGISGLDACLAEAEDAPQGVPYGTSILISGMPGGGKSSIATYIAAAQTGMESLILHGEERAERVKSRWNRLNLKDADPYLHPLKAAEEALDVIRDINAEPEGKGLGVVVVDSVQTMTLGGKRKYDAQLEACEMLVGQVCSAGGVLLLVSHVSKTGQDHAGSAALSHLVDIYIHVTSNAKRSSRMLEVRKNRMGRAGYQVPLNITAGGLAVGAPVALPDNFTGNGAAGNARDRAADAAYAALLEGRRLDGYDFELANTNGGAWRLGLEIAVRRLQREGYEMVQDTQNQRRGWRMVSPPLATNAIAPVAPGPIVTANGLPIELT